MASDAEWPTRQEWTEFLGALWRISFIYSIPSAGLFTAVPGWIGTTARVYLAVAFLAALVNFVHVLRTDGL